MSPRLNRIPALAWLVLLTITAAVFAWQGRFIQDDAYISFRYAQHLVEGSGLSWNPPEQVEGYSNLGWTLLTSGALSLGWDPATFTQFAGLLCFLVTIPCVFLLAKQLQLNASDALLVTLLCCANYSFLRYATGGLETSLNTLLVQLCWLLGAALFFSGWTLQRALLLSLLTGLLFSVRIDSMLLVLPIWFLVAKVCLPQSFRINLQPVSLLLPATIIIGAIELWRIHYYGDWLPNTWYAKTAGHSLWQAGLKYLLSYYAGYLLVIVLPFLIVVCFNKNTSKLHTLTCGMSLTVLCWAIYLIHIGGDFMEFRLMNAVLPITLVTSMIAINQFHQCWLKISFVITLLAGSANHAAYWKGQDGIESITGLQNYLIDPKQDWIAIGKNLHAQFFTQDPRITIAATPVGAIGYYSQLVVIDQHGLNDAWIARHGVVFQERSGHLKQPTLGYLRERHVNLVLGGARLYPANEAIQKQFTLEKLRGFRIAGIRSELLPASASIVEIPLNDQYKYLALYLEPHPALDALIHEQQLVTHPILLQ